MSGQLSKKSRKEKDRYARKTKRTFTTRPPRRNYEETPSTQSLKRTRKDVSIEIKRGSKSRKSGAAKRRRRAAEGRVFDARLAEEASNACL